MPRYTFKIYFFSSSGEEADSYTCIGILDSSPFTVTEDDEMDSSTEKDTPAVETDKVLFSLRLLSLYRFVIVIVFFLFKVKQEEDVDPSRRCITGSGSQEARSAEMDKHSGGGAEQSTCAVHAEVEACSGS
jgi:hypothetical protein